MAAESNSPVHRRVLVKISGEALAGQGGHGLDAGVLKSVAAELGAVAKLGVSLGVVIGGGNFFRGAAAALAQHDRVNADYIGMLATVMNALALQQALAAADIPVYAQSALAVPSVIDPYTRTRALEYLEQGRVVIFAAGTGNPLFTTDSAASLRAIEIRADIMLKATKVDGVFSADPAHHADAEHFHEISYEEVLTQRLGVMDATAVILCREHNLPIRVFDMTATGGLRRIVCGANVGTLISGNSSVGNRRGRD